MTTSRPIRNGAKQGLLAIAIFATVSMGMKGNLLAFTITVVANACGSSFKVIDIPKGKTIRIDNSNCLRGRPLDRPPAEPGDVLPPAEPDLPQVFLFQQKTLGQGDLVTVLTPGVLCDVLLPEQSRAGDRLPERCNIAEGDQNGHDEAQVKREQTVAEDIPPGDEGAEEQQKDDPLTTGDSDAQDNTSNNAL